MTFIAFLSNYSSVILAWRFIGTLAKPRHSSYFDSAVSLCLFFLVSYAGTFLFYDNTLFKPLVGAAALFFVSTYLYKGNLAIGLFCFIYMILVDILVMGICIIIFGKSIDVSSPFQQFFMAVHCNFLLFLFFHLTIHFMQKKFTFSKPFIRPVMLLLIYFFIALYLVGNMYDGSLENCKFNHSKAYHDALKVTMYGLIVIIIPLLYRIFKSLFLTEKELSKELALKKIQEEYEKNLSAFTTKQSSEKYIRHELINYIETYQQMHRQTKEQDKRI